MDPERRVTREQHEKSMLDWPVCCRWEFGAEPDWGHILGPHEVDVTTEPLPSDILEGDARNEIHDMPVAAADSACPVCGALPVSAGDGSGPPDTWFWMPGEASAHWRENHTTFGDDADD